MILKDRLQPHHHAAEQGEQSVNGLELWYGMSDTSRTEHLEGAGDHDGAALRRQIHGGVFSPSDMRQGGASTG